jgi:hypothetical protein
VKKLIKIQGGVASNPVWSGQNRNVIDFGTEGVLFWGRVDDGGETLIQISPGGNAVCVTRIETGQNAGDSTQKEVIDIIGAAVGANPGALYSKAGPIVGQLGIEQTTISIV